MLLVLGSFFMCKRALYSYAKFKFFATSILLCLNLSMIIYGITIVIKVPIDFAGPSKKRYTLLFSVLTFIFSDAQKLKALSILYLV